MQFRYQIVFDPTFGGVLNKSRECTPDHVAESSFTEPKLHCTIETTTGSAFATDLAQN